MIGAVSKGMTAEGTSSHRTHIEWAWRLGRHTGSINARCCMYAVCVVLCVCVLCVCLLGGRKQVFALALGCEP